MARDTYVAYPNFLPQITCSSLHFGAGVEMLHLMTAGPTSRVEVEIYIGGISTCEKRVILSGNV